jgi:hypothetical protein
MKWFDLKKSTMEDLIAKKKQVFCYADISIYKNNPKVTEKYLLDHGIFMGKNVALSQWHNVDNPD